MEGNTITSRVEDNKNIIRRYYDDLWNKWDLATVTELVSPNISFRGSLGITVKGREGFKDYVKMIRAAFPDFHNKIEELIAEGSKVVARLTYSGTHQGELFGIQATGKRVTYSGVAIFLIIDGKIKDGWVLGDTMELKRQLETG